MDTPTVLGVKVHGEGRCSAVATVVVVAVEDQAAVEPILVLAVLVPLLHREAEGVGGEVAAQVATGQPLAFVVGVGVEVVQLLLELDRLARLRSERLDLLDVLLETFCVQHDSFTFAVG